MREREREREREGEKTKNTGINRRDGESHCTCPADVCYRCVNVCVTKQRHVSSVCECGDEVRACDGVRVVHDSWSPHYVQARSSKEESNSECFHQEQKSSCY